MNAIEAKLRPPIDDQCAAFNKRSLFDVENAYLHNSLPIRTTDAEVLPQRAPFHSAPQHNNDKIAWPLGYATRDVVARLQEVSATKCPTHNKPMISKPEKDILRNDIRLHRTEIVVPCNQRAWEEGLHIIKSNVSAAIKPIVTPEGIELNKQMVALGNINSMFKYFDVKANAHIVQDYSFYTATI